MDEKCPACGEVFSDEDCMSFDVRESDDLVVCEHCRLSEQQLHEQDQLKKEVSDG